MTMALGTVLPTAEILARGDAHAAWRALLAAKPATTKHRRNTRWFPEACRFGGLKSAPMVITLFAGEPSQDDKRARAGYALCPQFSGLEAPRALRAPGRLAGNQSTGREVAKKAGARLAAKQDA
jgi:hypothetical protein